MSFDEIEICRLEVSTHIGVPDEERAFAQKIWVSVWMQVGGEGFEDLGDDVENTVNYALVAEDIEELASGRERYLIETMATDVADYLVNSYSLRSVTVKVEKKILPNADFVAVKVSRGG